MGVSFMVRLLLLMGRDLPLTLWQSEGLYNPRQFGTSSEGDKGSLFVVSSRGSDVLNTDV